MKGIIPDAGRGVRYAVWGARAKKRVKEKDYKPDAGPGVGEKNSKLTIFPDNLIKRNRGTVFPGTESIILYQCAEGYCGFTGVSGVIPGVEAFNTLRKRGP